MRIYIVFIQGSKKPVLVTTANKLAQTITSSNPELAMSSMEVIEGLQGFRWYPEQPVSLYPQPSDNVGPEPLPEPVTIKIIHGPTL